MYLKYLVGERSKANRQVIVVAFNQSADYVKHTCDEAPRSALTVCL
jgi:hypothetical protein